MTNNSIRMVPLETLLREFGREELRLKQAGDFQHAGWIRNAIIRIIRVADRGDASIDPTGDE